VSKSVQANTELWRVVLFRRNASELLVFETDSGLRLPIVDIPIHCRVAPALNARVKIRWNLDVYSLYPILAADACAVARYHIVEALQHDAAAPQTARWISLGEALGSRFAERSDFAAVQAWIESLSEGDTNGSRRPFEKPGWFFALKDLVQDAILTIPLTLNGAFLQLNASSSFSLIRFETSGEAVWFKAVGEPNTREFPLTVLLSSRLPAYLPRVLATQPLWNAWMMPAVPGIALSQTEDLSLWCNAARDLARLQIASIEIVDDIRACQARDARTETLLGQVKPFFTLLRELMELQAKTPPPRLSPSELEQLACDTREALLDLQRDGIPDTLGQLDVNPENIMALHDGTVFLDWAEASIGHPFLSFPYLLEYFLRSVSGNARAKPLLIRAYADVWESTRFLENPAATLSTSAFLAIFVHAVCTDLWRDNGKLLEPAVAGYYRSLARRMKKYRDRIQSGASNVCEVLA
jgi:hypothetical protein